LIDVLGFQNIVQPTIFVDLTPEGSTQRRVMPDKKERDYWWAFLAGRPEAEWNQPKTQKRPKKNAQDRQLRSSRMRAFPDDDDDEQNASPMVTGVVASQMPQETWHINDEGEVELALRIDPTESLPTPSGSPAPSSCAEVAGQQMAMETNDIDIPREPTPALLKLIDSARIIFVLWLVTRC
jgi:hypothetical protein